MATAMTNLAPVFGVKMGQAYITASANYPDVILYHSVIALYPFFIGWALVLRKWAFSPFAVFIMYGLTGYVAELFFMGFSMDKVGMFSFWIFVYGNMIWLPAYCLPEDRGAGKPPKWAYFAAPLLATLVAVPFSGGAGYVINEVLHHPPIHFPPIKP